LGGVRLVGGGDAACLKRISYGVMNVYPADSEIYRSCVETYILSDFVYLLVPTARAFAR